MLFVKVISTPYPPRKEPPENVMRGPGLLLQSYAEKSAEMVTGIGRLVLLMWGNDDDDAAKDGDVMGALDDPSVHAPARKSAPSRPAALRSAPVHMVASLSQRCGRLRRRGGPLRLAPNARTRVCRGKRCTWTGGRPNAERPRTRGRRRQKDVAVRAQDRGASATDEFSLHFGGVTARRCEASLSICASRAQAERRGERAQCDRAGTRQRAGRRPARQHFEGTPG